MCCLLIVVGGTYCKRGLAQTEGRSLRIVEWNVENLFHPSDNPKHDDADFTPAGSHRWTYRRFRQKLRDIGQTLCAIDPQRQPDLVLLCEVEDDSALIALTRHMAMGRGRYSYVCTHGDDRRGINLALLYSRWAYSVKEVREVAIGGEGAASHRPTRRLLYVKGCTAWGDTLHVVGCHLPSQLSRSRAAERRRQLAATTLRALTDSITQASRGAAIVVAGDFNCNSSSSLLRRATGQGMRQLPFDRAGTYRYKEHWSHLDHLLCSEAVQADTAHIAWMKWLLTEDKTYGGKKPRRTYLGSFYNAGISDHLPIYADLRVKKLHSPSPPAH